MKFFPLLCLLINLIPFTATGLEAEINFGFCASQGSGQAVLTITGGEMPYTYQWSDPNLEGNEVFDLSPGNYSVTINDAAGCAAVESFEIPNQSSIFLDYAIFDVSCIGFNDGQIFIDDFFPSDLKFSSDGINFSEQVVFENLEPGNFSLYVLESNGCITEEVISINEPFPVIVDLGDDVEILLGDSFLLSPLINSTSPLSYEWSSTDPNFNPCSGCFEIFANPSETTTYTITVSSVPGCSTSDEITIFVSKKESVYIPNIFTPNGDGVNDIFNVYTGISVLKVNKIIVRDNFGSIVYEANDFLGNDFNIGWDGTFRGKKLNPGVFIYYAQVEYFDGEIENFFGTVSIVE